MERRRALDGPLPRAGRAHRAGRSTLPPDDAVRRVRTPARASQAVSTTMAFTRLLRNLARDRRLRPAGRADHPRRGPHVRHGRAVPRVRDLRRRRARSTSRSTTRCCSPTPSRKDGQILEEGITEAGVHGELHRGRHLLRHPRRADGAVLHLLFDVRLPAGRRPHLGRGRRPGPGLPARRHRRAHDAARRGSAAPGRPQPRARLDGADVPGLRPGLRLRDGGDHPATASHRMYGARRAAHRRRRLLLPHPLQRELRDAGRARRRRPTTASSTASTGGPTAPDGLDGPRPRSCSRARPRARPARPQAELAEHYGVGAELWSRHLVQARCARRRCRPSAGTACTPTSQPRTPLGHRAARPSRRARSSPSPTS